jgi:hypothetical protein
MASVYRTRNVELVYKWPKVKRKLDAILQERLLTAAELVRSQVVRNISLHFTRTEGPSRPGQFPHRDYGRLAASYYVTFFRGELASYVASDLAYAYWLEVGTSKMAARPHLRPTMMAMRTTVHKVLTVKINRDLSR